MAKWRAIHGSISTSSQINELSEFEQLLFTWMIAHADDWGIMTADPWEVKATVVPGSSRTIDEVEAALDAIEAVGLIERYQPAGCKPLLHFIEWDKHQPSTAISKRTASDYPLPDGDVRLSISEADLQSMILNALLVGDLTICEETLVHIEPECRMGNSYIDILCHGESGQIYILEVKRHRLTKAAYKQIKRYMGTLAAEKGEQHIAAVLVGHGVAQNLNLREAAEDGIDIVSFDADFAWRQVVSCNVKWRYLTASNGNPCQGEDKNRVDKSRIDKSSAKAVKRDSRLDHAAIKGYRTIARLTMPIALRDDWIACADELGMDVLLKHVKDWIGHGYRPQNVVGMMDYARNGGKGGTHKQSIDDAELAQYRPAWKTTDAE